MKVDESKSQFGWENDDGIGESLVQEIIRGEKTATADCRTLSNYQRRLIYEI